MANTNYLGNVLTYACFHFMLTVFLQLFSAGCAKYIYFVYKKAKDFE